MRRSFTHTPPGYCRQNEWRRQLYVDRLSGGRGLMQLRCPAEPPERPEEELMQPGLSFPKKRGQKLRRLTGLANHSTFKL